MHGVFEHAKEDEPACYAGVKASHKNDGRNHEGVRDLLVKIAENPKSWRDHVLIACVSVDDSADNAKGNDLGTSASPQRLGEIPTELLAMLGLSIDTSTYRGSRISAIKLGMVVWPMNV